MKENVFALMRRSVENDIRALELLLECMDEEAYRKAVDLLAGARMTVTTACGSSGFAAKKFAHSLCCIECPAKFVAPSEGLHGGMGVLQPGDVLVAVSKGGKTDELLPMLDIAKKKNAAIIAVTQKPDSVLAKAADAVLLLPDFPESDEFNVMSTTSFAANISIFDALMMGLMEEKNYTLEQFALIHPGGAVGKRINP